MAEEIVNILIVDDDVNIRKTFSRILKLKGFNIEEATGSAEAISLAQRKFFNIAVIDIRLPDASGLDLLEEIRRINEDTIVIISTAYASLDSSIEAVNRGAYSYITKPVEMDAVLVVINRALEKQRLSIENRRLFHGLQEANEKLKEIDKRKSAFVANVSHEFKSPLAIIQESLILVYDGTAGPINPKQKELLGKGKMIVERMNRLVTDLLDLSQIESGKMQVKTEQFDLKALVNEILSMYEIEIAKKNLVLTWDMPSKSLLVYSDRDRLSEVVINLLNNAIKYTPSGGNIVIGLSQSETEASFQVSDNGLGISKDDLERIFDKFERIHGERQEGTGLGLPIAKDIIELLGGRIWVESQPGCGSKFIFTLPKTQGSK